MTVVHPWEFLVIFLFKISAVQEEQPHVIFIVFDGLVSIAFDVLVFDKACNIVSS